jgi:hypothetical protein
MEHNKIDVSQPHSRIRWIYWEVLQNMSTLNQGKGVIGNFGFSTRHISP